MFTVHWKVIPDNTSVHLNLYPSHIKGGGPIGGRRIHTGFHCFTKIGEIFHNKINTFIVKRQNFTSWKLEHGLDNQQVPSLNDSETLETSLWGVNIPKISLRNMPPDPLQVWAFSALENQSASIQDPRLGEPKNHSTRPAIGLRSSSAMTTTLIIFFSVILIFTPWSSLYWHAAVHFFLLGLNYIFLNCMFQTSYQN